MYASGYVNFVVDNVINKFSRLTYNPFLMIISDSVGLAARCYELMIERSMQRRTFGKFLFEHSSCQEMIADSAAELEMARVMTLTCATAIDENGADTARDLIAIIKYVVPKLAIAITDRSVQLFGGAGVSSDFPLARSLAGLRTLRIADGPDAVHKRTVALLALKKTAKKAGKENLFPQKRFRRSKL